MMILMADAQKQRKSYRIPPDLEARIKSESERLGLTQTDIVIRAVMLLFGQLDAGMESLNGDETAFIARSRRLIRSGQGRAALALYRMAEAAERDGSRMADAIVALWESLESATAALRATPQPSGSGVPSSPKAATTTKGKR